MKDNFKNIEKTIKDVLNDFLIVLLNVLNKINEIKIQ